MRRPAETSRLIAEVTDGRLGHQTIADAWGRGTRSSVALQLSGHRRIKQSLLDALYEITRDPQLVADVKNAAIEAWLERRPGADRERAFVDDVGGAS